MKGLQIMGVSEVAARLRVKHQTAKTWRLRGVLPEPEWTVSKVPVWTEQTILRWAVDTRRLTKREAGPIAPPAMLEPLLGVREIAELLDVAHQTAKTWRLRHVLPEPEWTVSNDVPVWTQRKVVAWALRTGRMTIDQAARF